MSPCARRCRPRCSRRRSRPQSTAAIWRSEPATSSSPGPASSRSPCSPMPAGGGWPASSATGAPRTTLSSTRPSTTSRDSSSTKTPTSSPRRRDPRAARRVPYRHVKGRGDEMTVVSKVLGRVRFMRPRYADVAATLALVVASGGTAYAVAALPAHSVGAPQLKAGAVTTKKVANGAVTAVKIKAGAVNGGRIADDSVSLDDLVGTDITGAIAFSVGAGVCTTFGLSVGNARVGQAALITFTATPPTGLVTGAPWIPSANHVNMAVRNETGATISASSLGIRVVTFG